MDKWKRDIEKVTRSPMEARKAYNKAASWIDIFEHPFEKPYKDRGLKLLNVQPGESILELGCGTGYALVRLAQQAGREGRVTGVDIAENMLAAAEKRLNKAGVNSAEGGGFASVNLIRCDAADIPVEDNTYAGIFSSFVLELFQAERITEVLEEIKRVLKPSGKICVVALSRENVNLPVRIYEFFHGLPVAVVCAALSG
jgi:demethylmenaquinone methyltransferase/2-methoxy-6-polyprenyl-1,4-benzoquinol methylase